jgi:hypothetical protein
VTIAKKKFGEPPKILNAQKAKNFFVPSAVTAHGRINILGAAKMHLIG